MENSTQKLFLITYADENYVKQQHEISNKAQKTGQFDEIIKYGKGYVQKTKWYAKHRELFEERGAGHDGRPKPGFFCWKPFVILDAMDRFMSENDVLLYIDCGDVFSETETMREFLIQRMKNEDILLTQGAFPNKHYTRRDAFVFMNCDEEKYHNATQVEAGIIVLRKTVRARMIINNWLEFSQDRRIISNDENVSGLPNLDGFKEHRWDQSILSCLQVKLNLPATSEMRRYVLCNKND